MSALLFDVRTVTLSKLILNLANPAVLAKNVRPGTTPPDIQTAVMEIADEIDRRERHFERRGTHNG